MYIVCGILSATRIQGSVRVHYIVNLPCFLSLVAFNELLSVFVTFVRVHDAFYFYSSPCNLRLHVGSFRRRTLVSQRRVCQSSCCVKAVEAIDESTVVRVHMQANTRDFWRS